jgi:hypothetical protein
MNISCFIFSNDEAKRKDFSINSGAYLPNMICVQLDPSKIITQNIAKRINSPQNYIVVRS